MKTSYLPRNKNISLKSRILQAVMVLVVGTIFFSLAGGALLEVVSPLWQGGNSVSRRLDGTLSYFRSKKVLEEENRILKERLLLSEELLGRARMFSEQSGFYTALLGGNTGMTAAVLVRPPQSPYDVLIVDKGRDDGLSNGSQVYAEGVILIGTVFEVEKSISRVRLFSSSGEKVNAVLERGQIPVVLEGKGGGNYRLLLNRDIEVLVGDRIIAPGTGAELLAVVGDINMSPTDAHKEVLARLPINENTLRFVQIR